MAQRILIGVIGLLVMTSTAAAAVPHLLALGVSTELAAWRARHYHNVRYVIDAAVDERADRLQGRITISLSIKGRQDLILDWRSAGAKADDAILPIVLNGRRFDAARLINGHLVISSSALRRGKNVVEVDFAAPIASTGTAITRYRDIRDDATYVYSLFVPADASSVFPCFDQPDLKAVFSLSLATPEPWQVVANAPLAERRADAATVTHRFEPTEPISTYLFAFAAGPFEAISSGEPGDRTRLFVRRSRTSEAGEHAAETLRLNHAVVRYLSDYFAQPFPFRKYDLVLIPQFPFSGMEHAGATFLREDAIVFPAAPNAADHLRRAQLIFHETAHQWFGDLVTMRWFDDLWLKEGFANLMAAKAAAAILPGSNSWIAFHALKTAAYRTDATAGTTPIYQPIANLADAKSAYGPIVYSKAPAVLRQAEFYLGEPTFKSAVRDLMQRQRYGAARWRDLVAAFERAAGRRLDRWAAQWVLRAGMPTIRVDWDTAAVNGRASIRSFVLRQDDPKAWPMRVQLHLQQADGVTRRIAVEMRSNVTRVDALVGASAPIFVFANSDEYGYGRFALDERSRRAVVAALPTISDDLLRAQLWSALWDDVRDGEWSPRAFVELALSNVLHEREEQTAMMLLGRLQHGMRAYLGDADRRELADRFDQMLIDGIVRSPTAGLRITFFRTLVASALGDSGRRALRERLAENAIVSELPLASRDRFRIIQRLLALHDPEAPRLLEQEAAHDTADDARRYAYAARAASPTEVVKRGYFEAFLTDRSLPESWIEEAIGPLNTIEHASQTNAFLGRALEALPTIKRERKIFFLNNWLAAFIGGQTSREALATVERFLTGQQLEPDLRRKILEVADELTRTVRIRERFGG